MKTGQLIKELRLKKGITQEELAAKDGHQCPDDTTYRKWGC